MRYRHREYITDEKLEAFQLGFKKAFSGSTIATVLRLSVKKTAGRSSTIIAMVGVPDMDGALNFALTIDGAPADQSWEHYGGKIAGLAANWSPEAATPLRRKGLPTVAAELLSDEVDAWEATWRAHLGGRLHAKAKEGLLEVLGAALEDIVRIEVEAALKALPAPERGFTPNDKHSGSEAVRKPRKKKAA